MIAAVRHTYTEPIQVLKNPCSLLQNPNIVYQEFNLIKSVLILATSFLPVSSTFSETFKCAINCLIVDILPMPSNHI